MMTAAQIEALMARVLAMGRKELVKTLRGLHCGFEVDFSDEYLSALSVAEIRHLVMGAALHDRPEPVHQPEAQR